MGRNFAYYISNNFVNLFAEDFVGHCTFIILFNALLAALNKIQSISYKELENNKLAIILMSDKETVSVMMEFWIYLLLYLAASKDLVFVFVLFTIAFIAMCIILPKKISKYYEKQLIK